MAGCSFREPDSIPSYFMEAHIPFVTPFPKWSQRHFVHMHMAYIQANIHTHKNYNL